MIRQLDIQKYGSYKDFKWEKDNEKFIFKKINIIYGYNYSGKTTLSRIFNTLEKRTHHTDYSNCAYEFHFDEKWSIKSDQLHTFPTDYEVKVFNSDFIKSNLSWLFNNDGKIEPFTVLGAVNVELQNEIRVLQSSLGIDIKGEETGYYKELKDFKEKAETNSIEHKKLNDKFSNELTSMAAKIRGNQKIYNRNPYTKTHLEGDIKKLSNCIELSDVEYKKAISQLDENELTDILYTKLNIDNFGNSITKAIELLKKSVIISNPIQTLLENDLLSAWVNDGIGLHKDDNTRCKFCGEPIRQETWAKLTDHFNKESEELQRNINSSIIKITEIKKNIKDHFLYKKNDFYLMYHDEYLQVYETWSKKKDNVSRQLDFLVEKLNSKATKITQIVNFDFVTNTLAELNEASKEIEILVGKNKDKTNFLKNDKNDLQTKILMSDISKFLREKNIRTNEKILEDAYAVIKSDEDKVTIKNKSIEDIKKKIEDLNSRGKDESKGAERVNDYLEKYFGSDEIKLIPVLKDGLTSYKIIRNGSDAKNLSDGECSLISFCYFVARVQDLLTSRDAPNRELDTTKVIIYIDDPISSLDNNHVFFIFSIIDEKIASSKKLHQLFISTHNLDFLKLIRRLTSLDDQKSFFTIEKHRQKNESKSVIKSMQPHLKEYVTEFNYLFGEMYEMYKDVSYDRGIKITNSFNSFYSLPNTIRKFLELYLFYRYPNQDTLTNKLKLMFDGNVPTLINRIVNEYSHLSYIERAWKPFDVPELETCVKNIFERMEEMDKQQFDVLVETSCKLKKGKC